MMPETDLGDRLAERGPVHDKNRQSRPQKRREHAEDGVGAEVRGDEARHDREHNPRQRARRAEDAEEEPPLQRQRARHRCVRARTALPAPLVF